MQFKMFTRILLIALSLVLSMVTLSVAQDALPDVNVLQLPALDQNPQRPGQDTPTLPIPEGNEHSQTTTGPANPFYPVKNPKVLYNPNQTNLSFNGNNWIYLRPSDLIQ